MFRTMYKIIASLHCVIVNKHQNINNSLHSTQHLHFTFYIHHGCPPWIWRKNISAHFKIYSSNSSRLLLPNHSHLQHMMKFSGQRVPHTSDFMFVCSPILIYRQRFYGKYNTTIPWLQNKCCEIQCPNKCENAGENQVSDELC